MQNVQTSLLPFNTISTPQTVPEGLTLREMVDFLVPIKVSDTYTVVTINNEVIPINMWGSIRPKQKAIVGINVLPSGGGGKKNPLVSLISIAVMVAAPYLAGYAAYAAGGGVINAATGAYTAVTAGQMALYSALKIGIGMIGYLATSALSSTPKQSYSGARNIKESTTQFIEGARNAIDRYGVVPANLGTNRMFPKQAALPYTETSNNEQYSRQLFTYGYGTVIVSDRKIGETSINNFSDIDMEDRLEGDLNTGTDLYSDDVFQEDYSVTLAHDDGATVKTTQLACDEAEVDITFFSGLVYYDDQGTRKKRSVEFEIKFAPTGTTDWSNGQSGLAVSAQSITIPTPTNTDNVRGIVVLNIQTGVAKILTYTNASDIPSVPSGWKRIASYYKAPVLNLSGNATSYSDAVITDERDALIPDYIATSSDFVPSLSGDKLSIDLTSGTLTGLTYTVRAATGQALRRSYRFVFPSRGQYDISVFRVTGDRSSDRVRDVATLTALKSITHAQPVNQSDVSGTAMRIRATDQLNGSVDQYNAIVSTVVTFYDATADSWIEGVSSNPAALYRYVLQSPAFAKQLADARIDLTKLEEWSVYCDDNNLTYNKIIDSETSVDDVLNDIAAAGMATIHKPSGIYSVIIDNERPTVSGLVTPRNSWDYKGNINYPELPHALRVKFRNKNKGYEIDERIVYRDGYDSSSATMYESVEFYSCTNATLAYYYGRRYFANALLQPETHSFKMDYENLTFNRGDRIVFVHDSILVGVGQGRIATLIYDNDLSPAYVTGFTIDDTVSIPTTDQFAVRIRHADAGGFTYHALDTVIGETNEFTFTTQIAVADAPPVGSLCAFVEDGQELDLIIKEIKSGKNQTATVYGINYAPARFDMVGTIPAFNSNVTLPIDFYKPLAPELSDDIQSDESVMTRSSDGSYTTRMVIPLKNKNTPDVSVNVRYRVTDTTQWSKPDLLSRTPDEVIITGLVDGEYYDFEIFYMYQTGRMLRSDTLQLNGIKFDGATANPSDVTGFEVTVSDSVGLFEWTPNTDIDLSHYVMKFTRLTSGATYEGAQIVSDNIRTNRLTHPIQEGTYFIKAVDILGNESSNAATITSFDNGAFNNVVENLTQESTWAGTKDNVQVIDGYLYLIDNTQVGYYYFDPEPLDLTSESENILSSSLLSYLQGVVRIRAESSIRSLSSIRGSGSVNIRATDAMRSLTSLRGFDGITWSVELQMNYSSDNITWSGWVSFKNGKLKFRYIKFRLKLQTSSPDTNIEVRNASVTVDMPDRYESGENQSIAVAADGATITYSYPFKNSPSVNITLQDGEVDDKLVWVSKDNEGFTIKVYNATVGGYVTRSFDYVSAGYGRIL